MKVYYCQHCGKWRGNNKICPECGDTCIARDLGKSRGDKYFIDGVDIPLARVTKILGASNKEALNYWVTKQAVVAALENPLLSVSEAMAARYLKRDAAASRGTNVHHIIESLGDKNPTEEQLKIPQIQAFVKFKKDIPYKLLESEKTVYSLKYKYAGTLDGVIEVGDRKMIIDWKTSKSVHDSYALQITAYKHALAELEKDKSILKYGMAIVHLRDNGNYSFIEMEDKWDVFLAHLTIYNWMNN